MTPRARVTWRLARSRSENSADPALPLVAVLAVALAAPRPATAQSGPAVPDSSPACGDDAGVAAGLSLSAGVDASLVRATVSSRTLGARLIAANQVHPDACGPRRQRTYLTATPKYDEKRKADGTRVFTRTYLATLGHLVYLPGNRLFASAQADLYSNTTQSVYLQQSYAVRAGATGQWARVRVEGAAGPAVAGQHFTTRDPSTRYGAASTSAGLDVALGPRDSAGHIGPGADVSVTAHSLVPLRTRDPTYADGTVLFTVPMLSRVSFTLSVFGTSLSNTPTGFRKTYVSTAAGFAVRLAPGGK